MSVRGSTPSPRICSGAIVYDVPRRVPTTVRPASEASGCISLAMPKSSSLTTRLPPEVAMKMLLALRSRWTMPCSCATCSAEQTGSRISSTSAGGNRPRSLSIDAHVGALEQLHHVERPPVGERVELVDVDDGRVLDHVDGLRLAHEPRHHLRRRRQLAPQHLHGRLAPQHLVLRLVDRPAAARGDLPLEDVGARHASPAPARRRPRPRRHRRSASDSGRGPGSCPGLLVWEARSSSAQSRPAASGRIGGSATNI